MREPLPPSPVLTAVARNDPPRDFKDRTYRRATALARHSLAVVVVAAALPCLALCAGLLLVMQMPSSLALLSLFTSLNARSFPSRALQ